MALVSFTGFETADDAALAAWTAHSALARRRGDGATAVASGDVFTVDQGRTAAVVSPAGVLARLLPPKPGDSGAEGWGFEIALLPEERVEIFAIARARVIWRALRSTGIYRRMHQFRPDVLEPI